MRRDVDLERQWARALYLARQVPTITSPRAYIERIREKNPGKAPGDLDLWWLEEEPPEPGEEPGPGAGPEGEEGSYRARGTRRGEPPAPERFVQGLLSSYKERNGLKQVQTSPVVPDALGGQPGDLPEGGPRHSEVQMDAVVDLLRREGRLDEDDE